MWMDRYLMGLPIECTRIKPRQAAKFQNNQEFLNQFEDLFTTALNLFRWEGLPDTCDERTIERSFLLTGQALIARYEDKYISLPAVNGANLNIYGYPLTVWGYGANGYNHEFSAFIPGADDTKTLTDTPAGNAMTYRPDAVIGYDNIERYPYIAYIFTAAARLADLMRSCDVAVKNLKAPYVIAVDEAQVKSVSDLIRTRDDNLPVIIGSKMISGLKPEAMNMGITPETLTVFWEHYRNVKSEILEVLGINANDNTDKKERLLVDEVNANNEEINHNLQKRLEQRLLWADRVNSFFGLNIRPYLAKEDWREEALEDADMVRTEDGGLSTAEGSAPVADMA